MNTPHNRPTNERIMVVASKFRYPPTPDITVAVLQRLESGSRPRVRTRSAWAIAGLLVLALVILFAVPGVRAEIVHFFQVGVVRIFPTEPTQTSIPSLPQAPLTATSAAILPATATPRPDTTPYGPPHAVTLAGIAGETTLKAAQERVSFPIRLPAYPSDLGAPQKVFLQEDGVMVILVWTNPAEPQKARLSLHEIGPGSILVRKFEPRVIQETQVNGQYAVWVEGPHLLELTNRSIEFRRIVAGNTLIWEQESITYRLESDLTIEEAIKIAESLE